MSLTLTPNVVLECHGETTPDIFAGEQRWVIATRFGLLQRRREIIIQFMREENILYIRLFKEYRRLNWVFGFGGLYWAIPGEWDVRKHDRHKDEVFCLKMRLSPGEDLQNYLQSIMKLYRKGIWCSRMFWVFWGTLAVISLAAAASQYRS